jgi:hypothetical protein
MERAKLRFDRVRGAVASICAFLYCAIVFPNCISFPELAICASYLIVPLVCIHFGARRSWRLESVGWFLLALLLGLVIVGG